LRFEQRASLRRSDNSAAESYRETAENFHSSRDLEAVKTATPGHEAALDFDNETSSPTG